MENDLLKLWEGIAEDWPTVILCKDADRKTLDGFPYAKGYFRNLLTGKNRDESLPVFRVGKLLATKKFDLVRWLAKRTKIKTKGQ